MKNKYTNLALGAVIFIALLLFYILMLRPQFALIRNRTAVIQNQRAQLSKREKTLGNTEAVREKRSMVFERITDLEKGHFVPFLHESIMLQMSSLFSDAGLQVLSMNFNAPERVPLLSQEVNEEQKNEMSGKNEAVNIGQFLDEAKALMEEGMEYKIPAELSDPAYEISRTSLMVIFHSESTKELRSFLSRIQAYRPEIRVASLEMSSDQSAWIGHMTLHFYALPRFSWMTEE